MPSDSALDALQAEADELRRELRALERRHADLVATERQTRLIAAAQENSLNLLLRVWESVAEGACLSDAQGVIVRVNQPFCELTGLAREDLEGKPLAEAVKGGAALARLWEGFGQGEVPRSLEVETLLGNQHLAWLELINTFVEAPEHPRLLLTVFHDCTAIKRKEEQRLERERRFLAAQKAESLGQLAGGVAHDFNNLLTGILGHAELALWDMPPDAPARPNVESIRAAAQRASELTRQMLAYAGKGRFLLERLDLSVVVQEMGHLIQVAVPRNVTVVYELTPGSAQVMADAGQVRQAVTNLVVNAAEAIGSEPGKVVISTGIERLDARALAETLTPAGLREGTYAFLAVADDGSGMDATTKTRMFDPFFTTKFTGRGLGLSAVLGIVRGHQGTLVAQSTPGRGTVVKLFFPLAASEASAPPVATDEVALGGGTILVIDDEGDVRDVAARMLQRLGFEVLLAGSGEAGVEQFRAAHESIRLTLLDLTMPGMTGAETLAELRRIRADAQVVLMSGYSDDAALQGFLQANLAGFIAKPFRPEELRQCVREALRAQG